MYGMSIQIDDQRARELLRNMTLSLAARNVRDVIGRSARSAIREHLIAYDHSHKNQLGGRRTHFYTRAARSAEFASIPGGVRVSLHHPGIAQRYFGGTIKPVTAKLLAIPAVPEAHGRRPAEFDNLELIGSKTAGFLALVERQSTDLSYGRRKGGVKSVRQGRQRGGRVMFWLTRSVRQAPKLDVLPTDYGLKERVVADLRAYLDQQTGT